MNNDRLTCPVDDEKEIAAKKTRLRFCETNPNEPKGNGVFQSVLSLTP